MTEDTSRPVVAVLDYGSGNVHSAVKALVAAGADARLTADRGLVAPRFATGAGASSSAALPGARGVKQWQA